jgi:hypothetical protein
LTPPPREQGYESPPAIVEGRPVYCGCGAPWFMVCIRRGELVVQMRQKHHGAYHYWEATIDELLAEIRKSAARLGFTGAS